MKHRIVLILTALATLASATATADPKAKINKCQDTQGRWHYGDTAAEACAQTKIEVMDQRGLRVKEVAAPPTATDLKAREAQAQADDAAKQQAADQAKRDKQLLATYGHEDDIALGRDRRLADVKAQMATSESTLATLRATLTRMKTQAENESRSGAKAPAQTAQNIAKTEAQIAKQEAALAERVKEQEAIKARYTEELTRYRELKGTATAKAPAAPPAK